MEEQNQLNEGMCVSKEEQNQLVKFRHVFTYMYGRAKLAS